jgi:hypothetical protein
MTNDLWTVVLKKGSKGEKRFAPEPEQRARQRAQSLAELHGSGLYDAFTKERLIEVDASKYYGG